MFELGRAAVARAILIAMLTFAIEEPAPWRRTAAHRAVAELLVEDVPADLILLDVAVTR